MSDTCIEQQSNLKSFMLESVIPISKQNTIKTNSKNYMLKSVISVFIQFNYHHYHYDQYADVGNGWELMHVKEN